MRVVLEVDGGPKRGRLRQSDLSCVVFIPIFMLPGLSGSFFRPLATAYVLAILASLFVALTVTPALALMLLPGVHRREDPPVVRWLKARYRSILPTMTGKPKQAVLILTVTLVLTAVAVPFLGEEFLPNFKELDFLMHWVEKPGTSLPAMRRITVEAAKELRAIPGVHSFVRTSGGRGGRRGRGVNLPSYGSRSTKTSLRGNHRAGTEDRGWLPRTSARPADIPPRAREGSADRCERYDRGQNLRAGS